VSAPEAGSGPAAGFRCAPLAADIIELAALRARTQVVKALAARRGLTFPAPGRVGIGRDTLVLCVRPDRWLLLTAPASHGVALGGWRGACEGCAAVIEHSCALTALHLSGPAVREVLARGCRLDLHPDAFAPGCAAATHMAQVSVLLAALPGGWLLLTPATTARHFGEWLSAAGGPFGYLAAAGVTVANLSGERTS
jgi:heterotetrameric sarcosine oxidase gamma subunit